MTGPTPFAFEVVRSALVLVAAERVDELEIIDPDTDVWRAFDLDSLDHLTVMNQIANTTGVDIAERDYTRLISLSQLCEHVEQIMQ